MTVDIKAAVELATRWRAENLVQIAECDAGIRSFVTLVDEGDLQLLTDALIALAPVVEAAQAWRDRTRGMTTLNEREHLLAKAVDELNGGK